MISSFKYGMRKNVTFGEFRVTLYQRRVNAMQSHARRVAAQLAKLAKASGDEVYMMDEVVLAGLCKLHGVNKQLIPDTVEHTKRLLTA